MPPRRLLLPLALLVGLLAAGGLWALADRGDVDSPLMVAEIPDAITALETELGEPAEFFEIYAAAQTITMWVAIDVDGAANYQPWVYDSDGGLASVDEPRPAEGPTFTAADFANGVPLDVDHVLDTVLDDLGGDDLAGFSIAAREGADAPVYAAFIQSARGGVLEVVVAGDGSVLIAAPPEDQAPIGSEPVTTGSTPNDTGVSAD